MYKDCRLSQADAPHSSTATAAPHSSIPPKTNSQDLHTKIRVASLNIRTLRDDYKLIDLTINATKFGQDFVLLQETHRCGFDDRLLDGDQTKHLNGWRFINSGFAKKSNAGVGILMSRQCHLKHTEIITPGRILLVKLIIRGQKIGAISAYAPDESYSESAKSAFWSTLSKTIKKVKPYKLVCGGDFNATVFQQQCFGLGPVVSKCCIDAATSTSFNGEHLLNICRDNCTYLENTWFHTKRDCHQWTFKSANASSTLTLTHQVLRSRRLHPQKHTKLSKL